MSAAKKKIVTGPRKPTKRAARVREEQLDLTASLLSANLNRPVSHRAALIALHRQLVEVHKEIGDAIQRIEESLTDG